MICHRLSVFLPVGLRLAVLTLPLTFLLTHPTQAPASRAIEPLMNLVLLRSWLGFLALSS